MLVPLKLEQARAVFLSELGKLAHHVHEKLYEDEGVFSVYAAVLQNRRATIRFGQDGLTVIGTQELNAVEGELLNPLSHSELETLQAALEVWGDEFRLKDPWLFDAALRALDVKQAVGLELPLQPTEHLSMLASAPVFQVFPNINGTYPEWEEIKKDYQQFLKMNQPKKPKKEQAEGVSEDEKNKRAVEKKKQAAHLKTFRRDVQWLIQRYFLDWEDLDILGTYEEATGEELTTYAVSQQIGRAKKALGLTL